MFTKILVPIDGSGPSDAAVDLALRIAAENEADVIFVHVVELSKVVALVGPAEMDPSLAIDAACKDGQAILSDAKSKADRAGVRASLELPEDECISTVLALARQHKADLIVVGSHGRRGIARAFIGSVAEGILRRSPIPVLVCHALPTTHSELKKEIRSAVQTVV